MTNETTASQLKSIGDDALVAKVTAHCNDLADCAFALQEHGGFAATAQEILIAVTELRAACKLRAPAAQATATIQAAPKFKVEVRCEQVWIVSGNDSFRLAYEAESDAAANWYAGRLRDAITPAAAIQEPVMVAEPLDMVLPCDIKIGVMTIRKGCKLRTLVTRAESLHRMLMEHMPPPTLEEVAAFQAVLSSMNEEVRTPMVADPAGVIIGYRVKHGDFRHFSGATVSAQDNVQKDLPSMGYYQGCADLVVTPLVAATVKAVPSEALAKLKRYPDSAGPGRGEMFRVVDVEALFAAPLADKTGGTQ